LFGGIEKLTAQNADTIPCDSISMYITNVHVRTCESANDQDCAFKPYFYCGAPVEYEMWIYDNFGNVIFETKDFNYGWEGKNEKGEYSGDGVYVWKMKITDKSGKKHTYTGKVSLIS
jgi:hypothetical protein